MNEWTDYIAAHDKGRLPSGDPVLDIFMPLIAWLFVLGVAFWLGGKAIVWFVKVVMG